jgi:hypothetical protein
MLVVGIDGRASLLYMHVQLWMTKMTCDDCLSWSLSPFIQAQAKLAFITPWTRMNPKSLSLLVPLLQQS